MSVTITLDTDGPRDPQYVLEVAEAVSQGIRVLNHLTRDPAALEYPSQADTLLRTLSAAVAGMPQLLGQVARRLEVMQQAGSIRMAGGEHPHADLAVIAARINLDAACIAAEELRQPLDRAASITCDMAADA